MSKKPKVVIEVYRGCINNVFSDIDIHLTIYDFDDQVSVMKSAKREKDFKEKIKSLKHIY